MSKRINLNTAGFPPLTVFLYFLTVYSDAPWKLLLWAAAPGGSHATLGAKCVGKFYHGPRCLGVRTNHHNTAHLQGGFDDWGGGDLCGTMKCKVADQLWEFPLRHRCCCLFLEEANICPR